nr:type II toxin-antitoxin system PemK/MazF family toxin [Fischerella sp. PCC 9605]
MPNGDLIYQRGEIRWVNLDPTVEAETQKTRPCLIVQNDIMNQYGLLTIVMPFRPGSKEALYVVNVKATPANGLETVLLMLGKFVLLTIAAS